FPGRAQVPREACDEAQIDAAHVHAPQDANDHPPARGATRDQVFDLGVLERRAIERAMGHVEGNMTQAAELLGIDRSTLWRKLKRMG
ncbi:MAG: helix-turn-helix domain-containing protein, partial [Myxococcota bacterium]